MEFHGTVAVESRHTPPRGHGLDASQVALVVYRGEVDEALDAFLHLWRDEAATEEVQKAFYAVSEKLYKNAAPQGEANADPNAGAGQQAGGNDDGVVDADYEEVKDN